MSLWFGITALVAGTCGGQVAELGSFDAAPNMPAAEGLEVWVQEVATDTDGYVYGVVGSRVQQTDEAGTPTRPRAPILNKFRPTGDLVYSIRVERQGYSFAAAPLQVVDMACSGEDGIFILTPDRVIRLDAEDGKHLGEWGGRGGASGQLWNPTSIAVDRGGYVYVCDQAFGLVVRDSSWWRASPIVSMDPGRLQSFTSEGRVITGPWRCFGTRIAVNPLDGNLYVVGTDEGKVLVFGSEKCSWMRLPAILQYNLRHPTIESPGFVFIPQGRPIGWGTPPGTNLQLAFDPEGRLYAHNSVGVWLSPSGSPAGPWSRVGHRMGAVDLAFDPEGNLVVPRGRLIVQLARPD